MHRSGVKQLDHKIVKMQEILLVLVLMGQCSFITCQLYDYHFIREKKTWTEAQKYCREKHTDLARVSDLKEAERLRAKTQDEAWIGLYATDNKTWHWTLPELEFNNSNTEWADNKEGNEYCVLMDRGEWEDFPCNGKNRLSYLFICYKETSKDFHLVQENKTWFEAQRFCRETHTDLISGYQNVQEQIKRFNESPHIWIGAFKDAWTWSDERKSSFRNWDWDSQLDENDDGGRCAVTTLNGTWMKKPCNQSEHFVCYDDGVILIRQNKTWEEAFSYCREHHYDLVSIQNLQEHQWVQGIAKKADCTHVWLGLRYTCTLGFWFWITDETVSYKCWKSPEQVNDCSMSGAMETGGQQMWVKQFDIAKFNFICFKK